MAGGEGGENSTIFFVNLPLIIVVLVKALWIKYLFKGKVGKISYPPEKKGLRFEENYQAQT